MSVHRGTTNGAQRGSSYQRRRRREWLIENYRADVDIWTMDSTVTLTQPAGTPVSNQPVGDVHPDFNGQIPEFQKACRCYRCGKLLTVDTVTVDRIVPGCHGGTYRRNNIRPACGRCNSETGGRLRRKGSRS